MWWLASRLFDDLHRMPSPPPVSQCTYSMCPPSLATLSPLPPHSTAVDPFSMSFNQYTEFRRDCGIEHPGKGAELDMTFVAANYEVEATDVNPDHALMRHELLEAVVRLAFVMYPPDLSADDGPASSVELLLEDHVAPTIAVRWCACEKKRE
jgi:hypothetical protein